MAQAPEVSRRIKVLYVSDRQGSEPWKSDVLKAVGSRHDLTVFDYDRPLGPQFADAEVVIDLGGHAPPAMADAAKSVKLWQILGTGFDHFELAYWQQKKIPVANCPGACSGAPLAEAAMLLILLSARRWREAQENLRSGTLHQPFGSELEGRHLALVGFGASAQELALRAVAFGMKISAIDIREIAPEEQKKFGLEFAGKPDSLDPLLSRADYLSLHLHLNQQTRHLIDRRRLGRMKPSAFLINVARGGLVDESALYEALAAGRLAGAGLDVFTKEPPGPDSPLLQLPNVIAMPHVAGCTDGTSRRRAEVAALNCDRIANGQEPLYRVDQ
jgi:phosphoglycerate dehydrogenase-like enzyme